MQAVDQRNLVGLLNMISEDEGGVIFRRPPGRGGILTDSESELDGESSRNSSRSASFDQDRDGGEPDDVDLGPGDLSDDGSHCSRQSSSPSPPPQGRGRGQGTGRPQGWGRGHGCGRGRGRGHSVALSRLRPPPAAQPDPICINGKMYQLFIPSLGVQGFK